MSAEDGFLYRSFQRALLFNIPAGVRMISFGRTSVSRIDVLVVSSVDLDPDARDFIFSAAGEVEGDFVDAVTCEIEFLVSSDPIESLPRLPHLVFAMAC